MMKLRKINNFIEKLFLLCKMEGKDAGESKIHTIIGSCKSGKSTLVRALVETEVNSGDRVYIVRNSSVRCDWIDDKFAITPDKFKNLDQMLRYVELLTKKEGKKIIIFEDALSMFGAKHLQTILRLMSIHRHTNTTYFIVSQTFKSLPNSVRSGEISDDAVVYLSKQGRSEVLKSIYSEMAQFDSLKQLTEMNDELEKFQFICVEKDEAYPIDFNRSDFEVRSCSVIGARRY